MFWILVTVSVFLGTCFRRTEPSRLRRRQRGEEQDMLTSLTLLKRAMPALLSGQFVRTKSRAGTLAEGW